MTAYAMTSLTRHGTAALASSRRSRIPSEGTEGRASLPALGGFVLRSSTTSLASSRRRRQVLAVPRHRQLGQRAVGVHLLDDPAHLVDERRRVERRLPVDRHGERLVEERISEDLDRLTILDRLLERRKRGDRCIESNTVTQREVADGGRIG